MRHGWEDAADGMVAVTSLVRVHQLLLERVDAVLRPLELTFARYEVLRLLSFTSAGSMPMTRLGSLLQVHPTSVTSAVDRLERQGFVVRERQAADRRVVRAVLTEAGREVVERATDGLNDLGLRRRRPRHRRDRPADAPAHGLPPVRRRPGRDLSRGV